MEKRRQFDQKDFNQNHFRLRGCIVRDSNCVLSDLIPGSYYRFRVRAVTKNGIVSEPGPESEPIFLGAPLEDEVFGLPGINAIKHFLALTSKIYNIESISSCGQS